MDRGDWIYCRACGWWGEEGLSCAKSLLGYLDTHFEFDRLSMVGYIICFICFSEGDIKMVIL